MSSNKRRPVPKTNRFTVMSALDATRAAKPRFNAFAGGYGPHGKRGYDRKAAKREFRKRLEDSN